jgi:hypothetical protein
MGDAEIFGAGVFISLWLVSFFGYSALQLRKGYQGGASRRGTATPLDKLVANP